MCIYVYVFFEVIYNRDKLRDRKEQKSTAQGGEFFPTFRKGAAKSVGVKPKIWINYRHKTERIARDIYIYIKTIEIRISRVLFIV